jgi:hypothetical protein
VLAYAAEESERMQHKHIGTPHLLAGLLVEEQCFAAQVLGEQGVTLDSVRELVRQSAPPSAQGVGIAGLDQWIAALKARSGSWIVKQNCIGNRASFAFYAADQPKENETDQSMAPAEKLTQIQKSIDFISEAMEFAIANHEFEQARFYSEEERKERENLRRMCEQFKLPEPPSPVPLLCIEIIRYDLFSDVRKRCDAYIAAGVAEVWLLDPDSKRAYTVTKTEGLREYKAEILRFANPPLEMDLKGIFD